MDTKGKRNQGPTKYRLTLILKYLRASRLVGLPRFVMNVLIKHLSTINTFSKKLFCKCYKYMYRGILLILFAQILDFNVFEFFLYRIYIFANVMHGFFHPWIKAICFLPIIHDCFTHTKMFKISNSRKKSNLNQFLSIVRLGAFRIF